MDLSSYIITADTPPELLPFIRAYQPAREVRNLQTLREDHPDWRNYRPQTNTMEELCSQCGTNYNQYMEEKRELLQGNEDLQSNDIT